MLLPALGFLNQFFFIYSFVSDHWQYLACLGNHHALRQWDRPAGRTIERLESLAGAWNHAAAVRSMFLLTWQQSRMYTDIETLYRTTIARNPACWMAYNNLGNTLLEANRIPEAMDLFNRALRIKPAVDTLAWATRCSEQAELQRQ